MFTSFDRPVRCKAGHLFTTPAERAALQGIGEAIEPLGIRGKSSVAAAFAVGSEVTSL